MHPRGPQEIPRQHIKRAIYTFHGLTNQGGKLLVNLGGGFLHLQKTCCALV